MKLSRPAKREPNESILPLIDVVFFLLVFFMLIGRMDATAPFDVRPAIAVTGSALPGGGMTIAIAVDGALALDGDAMIRNDLVNTVSERLKAKPDTLLRINVHARTQLANMLPLVSAFERLGASNVVLIVTPQAP